MISDIYSNASSTNKAIFTDYTIIIDILGSVLLINTNVFIAISFFLRCCFKHSSCFFCLALELVTHLTIRLTIVILYVYCLLLSLIHNPMRQPYYHYINCTPQLSNVIMINSVNRLLIILFSFRWWWPLPPICNQWRRRSRNSALKSADCARRTPGWGTSSPRRNSTCRPPNRGWLSLRKKTNTSTSWLQSGKWTIDWLWCVKNRITKN